MSIRSTEFIDDAVRDSKATNELEIKDTGFAIGQLADLEKWYQETVKSMVGASAITVTGYSLGGHVATAFEQLHRGDGAVAQVFNFNGAGVGSVKEGHRLADVLAEFDKYRSDDKDLSYMFTTPEALKLYQEVRATLGAHQRLTDAQVAQAKSLGQSFAIGDQTYAPAADALLLSQAIARIKDVQDYAAYVDKVKDPKPPSKDGLTLDVIEQDDINYQIGILKAADLTQPMSIFRQVVNLPFNHGPRSEQRDNIFDVTGATHWSAVANSQYHHGRNTQIYIENQPLVRGDFVEEMAKASEWLHADIKLLVDNFSTNSFGDTHSLVLLQDSLSVQGQANPGLEVRRTKTVPHQVLASLVMGAGLTLALGACSIDKHQLKELEVEAEGRKLPAFKAKLAQAEALFQQRCETAGEFIYKTVPDVKGVVWMRWRINDWLSTQQYEMDDPYGKDCGDESCVEQLLRSTFVVPNNDMNKPLLPENGYEFVETVDPRDGRMYRYTAGVLAKGKRTPKERPIATKNNNGIDPGEYWFGFGLRREAILGFTARYGIVWDDVSTREDREYWIAGGSLTVTDLKTGEVIAKRVGYMMDRGLGSSAGSRSPWDFASYNSCPVAPKRRDGYPVLRYHEKTAFLFSVIQPTKGETK